jgi:Asp-tRNA(Asn)/Glu-tRNA(Gln) amidotransferase A subunit family amidase
MVCAGRATVEQLKEVSLPTFELGLPAYYVIASSEASSNLSRYDGVRYGTRAPAADLTEMYTATRQVCFCPLHRGPWALSLNVSIWT